MRERRKEKVTANLARLVSGFLKHRIGKHTLVTVTRVTVSNDAARGTVWITVYPSTREKEVLNQLDSLKKPLQDFVRKQTKTRVHPDLSFAIDMGEKNRQRIEELLDEGRRKD